MSQYDTDIAGKPGKRAAHWILLANRKEDFGKLAADRRQRSLLLPVAGGRKRKEEPATRPAAVAMKPRKKASRLP